VCVCVCVCVREGERERERDLEFFDENTPLFAHDLSFLSLCV